MKLFGEHDPTGGDGYVPGAWDEVRAAYLDGRISEEAYDIIRLYINPPAELSTEKPAWGTEDYRRWATLFNDITHAPIIGDLLFSDRHKLTEHLWAQGWRREVRPEDVTPRPSTAFERPEGNIHIVPDDFPLESTERPTIIHTFEIQDGE